MADYKWLSVEIAGYYDHMENANVFNGTEWTVEDFDPRLGFIVTPTGQDTFRLAAFRYILPFIAPRLDPTDIAGIPIFRNSQEGSQNTEYAFSWDHEWENGFSSINIFYLKKDYTDKILDDGQEILRETNGKTKGIEVEHNQLLTERIGSFAQYRYLDIDDDLDTLQEGMLSNVNRREHLFNIGLKYVHPDGYFAGGTQTLRYIDNQNSRTDETAAITDFEIGYQFPEKRGEVSFKVLNLFNEHYNWITDRLVLEGRQPTRQISFTLSLNF